MKEEIEKAKEVSEELETLRDSNEATELELASVKDEKEKLSKDLKTQEADLLRFQQLAKVEEKRSEVLGDLWKLEQEADSYAAR